MNVYQEFSYRDFDLTDVLFQRVGHSTMTYMDSMGGICLE